MSLLRRKKGDMELSKVGGFILVAVVLIIVVAFFLGGTTGITKTIKNVFFGVTAGTDLTLAVANCKHYCEQTKTLGDEQKSNSAYCKHYEHIDQNQDGQADYKEDSAKGKLFTQWYCPPAGGYVSSPSYKGGVEFLNVPCDVPVQC